MCNQAQIPTRDELFKEYELCQNSTQNIESKIWKTSGIIGIATLATTSYLAKTEIKTSEGAVLICAIGAIIILVLWIWWGMAKRWWDIQHIIFMRMRHIEEDLGIFQYRYISFIDGKLDIKDAKDANLSNDRINKLKKDNKVAERGVQKTLKYFPLSLSFSWGIFIIYQMLCNVKLSIVCSIVIAMLYYAILIIFYFVIMPLDFGDEGKKSF